MEIGLVQNLAQKQVLSPQMIQSMEILVLNSQQLEERIEQELETNVALERIETGDDAVSAETLDISTQVERSAAAQSTHEVDPVAADEIDLLRERYEHLAELQSFDRASAPGRVGASGDGEDDKFEALQNTSGRSQSLQQSLIEQLRLRTLEANRRDALPAAETAAVDVRAAGHEANGETAPAISSADPSQRLTDDEYERFDATLEANRQYLLCLEIIYSLDQRGFMLYPLEEIHRSLNQVRTTPPPSANGLGDDLGSLIAPPVSVEELDAAAMVVQSLDPPGVGAADLTHCLLLQLDRDGDDYPLEREIIRHHLKDIAKNRLPQVAKATGRTLEDVKDAVEIIGKLNPNPGRDFADQDNAYVKPDVIIEEVDGVYKVVVEDSYLPRVRISPFYRTLLEQSRKDPEIRKYIKSKIDNAEWLMHALQQRNSTLQRVAQEVVKHQQDFFSKGPRYLRPLKMQDIADKIGVNVSTVSRAISGKYFQSPDTIKDLKFLFTSGTTLEDGSTESRDSVIMRIKDLLAKEDTRKPMSDSKIVKLLSKGGINISRRTVTKYREAERIPSSRERRQF
ncbi:MAG: RNA polymerase factor sigma-54 [Planctomycetota bacterium]